jgi:uncharacterized RDD family membrane protein YckC
MAAGLRGTGTSEWNSAATAGTPRLEPGQIFGRYRIERLIGRGGMGEVYAAEQLDTGRRLALKVLAESLADPHDRARFLREGQLAASVSHPNSVYVFGSEEIDGIPAITMELLPGGTLKHQVKSHGPMSPTEAVGAILQVLAGLDAAQAAGVLHRDVKPGNCFTDADGTVKVGDFGLSISTLARDVGQSAVPGGFRGTPQFASPEQLRGAPLDVRSDIYAAGATLFYLLTSRPPFEETDLVTLVARVSVGGPPSPRQFQPLVPRGLARVVLQCLARDPDARPASYATLTRALRPYAGVSSAPANLGVRLIAGLLDAGLVALVYTAVMSAIVSSRGLQTRPPSRVTWLLLLASVTYFSLIEGLWSASVGKRLCGLRVVRMDGGKRVGSRALVRAVLYYVGDAASRLPSVVAIASTVSLEGFLIGLTPLVFVSVLFSTARRHNGFAALHDLITGTRVVARIPAEAARPVDTSQADVHATSVSLAPRGPFEISGLLCLTDTGQLLLGFDPALRRSVWIHQVPVGTPPIAATRREIGRPSRLRWLAGIRNEGDAWDAYEALDGEAAGARLGDRLSWGTVRQWLNDITQELNAQRAAGAEPSLSIERIWITRRSLAVLLDFEIRASPTHVTLPDSRVKGLQPFLASFVRIALGEENRGALMPAKRMRLPLSARALIGRLAASEFATLADVAAACREALTGADAITRRRRAAPRRAHGPPRCCGVRRHGADDANHQQRCHLWHQRSQLLPPPAPAPGKRTPTGVPHSSSTGRARGPRRRQVRRCAGGWPNMGLAIHSAEGPAACRGEIARSASSRVEGRIRSGDVNARKVPG